MERAAAATISDATPGFRDGLGERRRHDLAGTPVEWLCLQPELAAVPSFEFALRERVSRLGTFRHPAFGRIRGVERAQLPGDVLVLASDETPGIRLSSLLDQANARALPFDLSVALNLLRQLVPAVASLHETARDAAHGALAPERLVVTPEGRLVVVEYALGSALEQLLLSREKYWTDLRVALPRVAGLPRFDHVTDVTQLGIVALSLILGRNLQHDEYPSRIPEIIRSARAVSKGVSDEPLPAPIRFWLERVMQVDSRQSFPSAIDVRASLEQAIAESGLDATPRSIELFMTRFHGVDRPPQLASAATPLPMRESVSQPTPAPMTVPQVAYGSASAPTPPPLRVPAMKAVTPSESVFQDIKAAAHESESVEQSEVGRAPTFGQSHERIGRASDAEFVPAPSPRRWWIPAAAVAAVLVIGLVIGAPKFLAKPAPVPASTTGTLVITTDPPGARAVVDGKARGTTPLTLTLDAGSHKLELRSAGGVRTIPISITAGEQVSQYVDLPRPTADVGQLRVRTQPEGAQVLVDNAPRGTAPIVIPNLTPGEHVVTVKAESGTATQTVTIEAGVMASVMLPIVRAENAPLSGWVTMSAPFPVHIFENGELIGSSDTDRVMVAAGRHEFDLRNESLGYRSTRTVQVTPGKLSTVNLDPPKGQIAINAQPWAEVWIDGAKVGETPIGNLSLPIGSHEVVFRHPDLGEQKKTATVTLTAPTRLIVDMKKP